MLDVPRAARLAAWGTATLTGAAGLDATIRAVSGGDASHSVDLGAAAPARSGSLGTGLVALIAHLAGAGANGLRVVLPAPGDPAGLPGPPALNAAALEAGEVVLAEPAAIGLAVVPQVRTFGSAAEPGVAVTWHLHRADPGPRRDVVSAAEADRELRLALLRAVEDLDRLDVAGGRADVATDLARLGGAQDARGVLPPSMPGHCVRLAATASRLRAVVALAAGGEGGAVSAGEAARRAGVLGDLDDACRHALAAAANGLLER